MKYTTLRNSSGCLWKCGKVVQNGIWTAFLARKSKTTTGTELCGCFDHLDQTLAKVQSFHRFHNVITILPKLFTSPIVERWREIAP